MCKTTGGNTAKRNAELSTCASVTEQASEEHQNVTNSSMNFLFAVTYKNKQELR
jgi:hypothetical protein